MAKQNTPNINKGNPVARTQPVAPKKQPVTGRPEPVQESNSFFAKNIQFFIVAGIAVLTYLCYQSCLENKLTNWDDLGYIINNSLIKDTGPDAIKNIFSLEHPVMGNYHPLTILPYYFEYQHYGLQPWIYHFDSVLLQILCTITVYFFVKVLTKRTIAATVVALLFGLHPMHVESVAWAAGRKDIIYGIFFVLCCAWYVFYLRSTGSKKIAWYISILVFFTLSLLSKAVAVTLPVTLFLIDYFEGRNLFITQIFPSANNTNIPVPEGKKQLNYWILLDKLPLLALAYQFGNIATHMQEKIGATKLDVQFSFLERFALGCYALCSYLWKAVVPTGLSNFYPYPLKVAGALPSVYFVYPVIIIGLIVALILLARKNKVILFGVGFFMINIVLLLQFIPVGGAIMSDRYGYIPYIGLFFIAGWYISEYFVVRENLKSSKKSIGEDIEKHLSAVKVASTGGSTGKILLGGMIIYCLVLGFLTSERCKDWYDSVSLWRDDIEKHPEAPVGYFYLGQEYFERYEKATNPTEKKALGDSSLANFNLSIARKPDYINPTICIAELQRNYGQIDEAKNTYFKALKIDNTNESVYLGLGVIYAIKHQYDSSDYVFKKALSLKAFLPEGYSNYANFLDITGKTDSSLAMYKVAISQNPDAWIPYMNRGKIYVRLQKYDEALKDLNRALEINGESGESYYLRARCLGAKGNKVQAQQDVEKAKSFGYTQMDPGFLQGIK